MDDKNDMLELNVPRCEYEIENTIENISSYKNGGTRLEKFIIKIYTGFG